MGEYCGNSLNQRETREKHEEVTFEFIIDGQKNS